MKFKKIVVIGGGVLGSQIAFQSAYCGMDVTIWLRSEASIGRAQPKLAKVRQSYIDAINLMATKEGKTFANWARGIADQDNFNKKACLDQVEVAANSIKLELDLAKAVKNADLVIEAMAEDPKEKIAFYKKLAPVLSPKTIVVTNSSTLLPSRFAKFTGRPDKFLALHFANSIWKNNTAEVMAQPETSEKSFRSVMEFAEDIHMVPLPVNKEKSGYLLNSMLVPFLLSGMDLMANGVSDPASIDQAWVLATGAPKGPFRIIDTVGLVTARNIVAQYQKVPGLVNPLLKKMMLPYNYKGMLKILDEYIAAGKLGKSAGEGFYKY